MKARSSKAKTPMLLVPSLESEERKLDRIVDALGENDGPMLEMVGRLNGSYESSDHSALTVGLERFAHELEALYFGVANMAGNNDEEYFFEHVLPEALMSMVSRARGFAKFAQVVLNRRRTAEKAGAK